MYVHLMEASPDWFQIFFPTMPTIDKTLSSRIACPMTTGVCVGGGGGGEQLLSYVMFSRFCTNGSEGIILGYLLVHFNIPH